ncbi:Leucine Rich Repeat [Seminavis robusta]|uniref:Leucine Rich Repeat n=1 Tax=Seminavis robusta TaxID=568900 RepID=A0A9N8D4M6_9STRA|nr:Leucine Rich Repeat [Seminavis robusta]|eukprot:Sro4_g003420.1 Leucine Rich Repeat (661) ;mRNA; f:145503-147485
MKANANESKAGSRGDGARLPPVSVEDENVKVDGDVVDIIDVDEWMDGKQSAAVSTTAKVCGDTVDSFTLGEFSCEIDVDDLISNEHQLPFHSARKGREEVPLSHYPDMDEVSGPKDHYLSSGGRSGLHDADGDTNSGFSVMPDPLTLRSSPAITRRQPSPGAFRINPTHRSNPPDDDDDAGTVQILSCADDTTYRSDIPSTSPAHLQHEDMLVQATLVTDGDSVDPLPSFLEDPEQQHPDPTESSSSDIALVEAKPMDEKAPSSFRNQLQSKWTQFHILLVMGLASTALALGLLLIGGREDEGSPVTFSSNNGNLRQTIPPIAPMPVEEQTNTPAATTTPTTSEEAGTAGVVNLKDNQQLTLPTGVPTMAPTVIPSTSPSFMPTSQDTSFLREFYSLLPDYSTSAMQDPESPQFKSFQWLSLDPYLETYSLDQVTQRFALSTVLTAIGISTSIINDVEMHGVHECGWAPMNLKCEDQKLTYILLNNFDLTGSLPLEVGLLTSLRRIEMSTNTLTSSIPTTVGLIKGLEGLDLQHNNLSGELPQELSSLTLLQELNLNNNRFSTSIPSTLGLLINLQRLSLAHNALTGTIPDTIGSLYNITVLELQDNALEGMLPIDVCALQEWSGLSQISVDCSEVACYCICVCYTDHPESNHESSDDSD